MIAIAITLLVLEFVPHIAKEVTGRALVGALLEMWPELLAYFLSFLVIGRFWDTHRGFFEHIVVADARVVWTTLTFLLWVTLIPATAALLGSHWREPAALTLTRPTSSWRPRRCGGCGGTSAAGYLRREGLNPRMEAYVDRFGAIGLAGYALVVPAGS